jgi:FAD/FMN-containing dehydrogenase
MIGNNSAGSHSIVHGKTIDHVRKLRVLLSDGNQTAGDALKAAVEAAANGSCSKPAVSPHTRAPAVFIGRPDTAASGASGIFIGRVTTA